MLVALCESGRRVLILRAGWCMLSHRYGDELGHVRFWECRVPGQALLCGEPCHLSTTFSSALGAAISERAAISDAPSALATSS